MLLHSCLISEVLTWYLDQSQHLAFEARRCDQYDRQMTVLLPDISGGK